jgi:hypothetical protein
MLGKAKKPGGQSNGDMESNHYAEIVRPEMLGQWVVEKNSKLQYLQEAMQDWGERRGDPHQRPVCMTCPHEFDVSAGMPSAWMFLRLSVNENGEPKHMTLIGICEACATKDDIILLWEGLDAFRRAFPEMAGFTFQWIPEGSNVLN